MVGGGGEAYLAGFVLGDFVLGVFFAFFAFAVGAAGFGDLGGGLVFGFFLGPSFLLSSCFFFIYVKGRIGVERWWSVFRGRVLDSGCLWRGRMGSRDFDTYVDLKERFVSSGMGEG